MEFATKKTNETWIILDDLKEDTQYYAFVVAKRDNLTSEIHYTFHFSLNESWTGLSEPDITIESVFKKEVFTPGDPMTIKCSFLPNSNLFHFHYDMELTVGERVESLSDQLPKDKLITPNRQTFIISQRANCHNL
ncbi:hypothetical protein CAEBREN_17477 [Caenorhabditis brenneri]|uniref:Uncharacterized protein n=1 Tax=Caenorhabditis brenneri TaxID=135651 RepID=G0P803_CAEBE|nr:hypothetical protein CAEBREN_17477 [Caenorhabditis brenneri]